MDVIKMAISEFLNKYYSYEGIINMNKEHVAIFLSGVEKWNKWRIKNPEIIPDLQDANLRGANLEGADLQYANLRCAYLEGADLQYANLRCAYLEGADLQDANLRDANLEGADLQDANLRGANLYCADLQSAKGLKKQMNVQLGDIYWKRFDAGLCNFEYQYYAGINKLRENEVFAADERILCSYPGFHFASREWCSKNYPNRPLEAKIRIPLEAKINEPWATDGKASADMIEILQVFDVTGEDVTEKYRKVEIDEYEQKKGR